MFVDELATVDEQSFTIFCYDRTFIYYCVTAILINATNRDDVNNGEKFCVHHFNTAI
jgi:hypothetical protein